MAPKFQSYAKKMIYIYIYKLGTTTKSGSDTNLRKHNRNTSSTAYWVVPQIYPVQQTLRSPFNSEVYYVE